MPDMTQLIVWLNSVANACASVLLTPIALLPGWLSATLVAAVTGVLMLVVFKHTSNQRAIKRARATIKANLLALSLFKDSAAVSLRSQGRVLLGAGQLLMLAIIPMLVMLVPMCLLLGQLALWYQARPLRVDEEAVVTLTMSDGAGDATATAHLAANSEFAITVGPVRVPNKHMVCWNVQARQPGNHRLTFEMAGQQFEKEFVAGDGFMPVSLERPGWAWSQALLHPRESPFPPDSPVQGIEIDYPQRQGFTCGSRTWVIYWFVASMVAAFAAKPFLKVSL
jgi:hypothetical protein